MVRQITQVMAIFCICLIINTTIVYGGAISHTPSRDVAVLGNSAVINWTTNELSDSRVNYGNRTNLSSYERDRTLSANHSITLYNLLYNTLYYYELLSANSSGNITLDNNHGNYYTFRTGVSTNTTVDTTPIEVQAEIPALANRHSINFRGKTKPDAFLYLYVNPSRGQELTTNYNRFSSSDDDGNFTFRAVALPLQNNTIILKAVDTSNNRAFAYFNVTVDDIPPAVVMKPDPLPGVTNTTALNINGNVSEKVKINYTINNITSTLETDKDFSFSLNLDHNRTNNVSIEVSDLAGNIVDFKQRIYVDSEAPQILETNLDQLSPSYTQEVTIRGRISEPNATVIIFVNNQTSLSNAWTTSLVDNIKKLGKIVMGDTDYIAVSDSNGYFEIDVLLTINLETEHTEPFYPDQLNTSYGQDTYYYGRTIRTTGSANEPEYEWDNDIRIVVIDRVGLKNEVSGKITYAKCGHGSDWNIKISDVSPSVITPELLRRGIAQFGFSVELEWQGAGGENSANITETPIVRTYQLSEDRRKQYQIDPQELVGRYGPQVQWSEDKKTGYVIVRLSAYNYTQPPLSKIEMSNLTLHIPMMIEIHYNYDWFGAGAEGTQKQCWDADLLLDVQVPPSTIPKWLLNSSIYIINNTIYVIDRILKPLRKISLIVFVTCISSWLVYFLSFTQERLKCLGLEKDHFGQCTEQQNSKDPDRCAECNEAIASRKKVESLMHWVCDRMFCPSVPSVTRFMQTNKVKECKGQSIVDYKKYTSTSNIKATLMNSKDPESKCILDYVEQWEAGCVFEDEFKLSKCTELGNVDNACGSPFKQFYNKAAEFCEAKEGSEDRYVNYKGQTFVRTTDSATGNPKWCLGESVETGELEKGTGKVKTKDELVKEVVADGKCDFRVHGSNNFVYQPKEYDENKKLDKTTGIYMEGKEQKFKYENLNTIGDDVTVSPYGENAVIGSNGQVYAYRPKTEPPRWEPIDPTDKNYYGTWKPFKEDYYDQESGQTYGEIKDEKAKSNFKEMRAPEEVEDEIITAKPYIIKPASSFLRALQCVCLPAVTGYLTLWRNILEQVMLCFQSVLVTGNPNTGLCRSVLTVYVCDIIFDAINCFVNKYSSVDEENPNTIGGFMKSVAGGGKDVQESIINRYGETSLYDSMFNERKLIHQLCLAAFTGDWDIDLESMLTGAGAIPIKSEGFLYPHTMRFITSNPLNGRTTFIYNIGVGLVAGADINYKLELICSNDMSCSASDGFPNGQCDCFRRGQPEIFPVTNFVAESGGASSGSGRLAAGEMIGPKDGDVYIPAYDQAVRFDKVRLSWTYVDNDRKLVTDEIVKPISLIGGQPPADCQFDLASLEFRCSFKIGDKGYAVFSKWPEPEKEYYYINDNIKLKFRIEKKSPGYKADSENPEDTNAENQIPKYLCWEVRNGQGRVIKAFTCTEIREDGYFTEDSFPMVTGVSIKMTDILSGGYGGGNCRALDNKNEWPLALTCNMATSRAYKVTYSGGAYKFESGNYDDTRKTFAGGGTTGDCTKKDEKTVECGGFVLALNTPPRDGTDVIIGFIEAASGTTGTGSTQCNDITEKSPQSWIVTLSLVNAKKMDEERDMTASNAVMNPSDIVVYSNKKQEAKISLKVVCSEFKEQKSGKCQGFGHRDTSQGCKCYKNNDETSGTSELCGNDKLYCYNPADSAPQCLTGQCNDMNTINPSAPPCDCDGDYLIDRNECAGKYCIMGYSNRETLKEMDIRKNTGLIDENYCSEFTVEQLRQKLGVT